MEKPLHPLQIDILKILYGKKMTIYKVAKKLNKQTPLIQFHVRQLYNKKLLIRKEMENRNGFLYYTNKRTVKIINDKDKEILYIRAE